MDRKIFEDELKREGYDVMTNTTPGAKVNPEHSHPFDVKALVLKGAMSLTRDGKTETYKAGQTFSMPRGCVHSKATATARPSLWSDASTDWVGAASGTECRLSSRAQRGTLNCNLARIPRALGMTRVLERTAVTEER